MSSILRHEEMGQILCRWHLKLRLMGNCSEKGCDYCCPKLVKKWAKIPPKLLDETLSLLLRDVQEPSESKTLRSSERRQKIDGRDGEEFSVLSPLLNHQEEAAGDVKDSAELSDEDQLVSEQESSSSNLQIYTVTWNMNGKLPSANLGKLLEDGVGRYDMYVVGLQEAASCNIEKFLVEVLGISYSLIAASVMLSLQLFVFARTSLMPYITDPRTDRVGLGGLGGVVRRQKGAVAISLRYRNQSFLFLSCHLAPHEGNVEIRNAQYARICSNVFTKRAGGGGICACLPKPSAAVIDDFGLKHQSLTNIVEDSDIVIWIGDLNYRVVGRRNCVGVLIKHNLHKLLWSKDQLTKEMQSGRVFNGFLESPLSFRPSYKYDVGTDDYDTSAKERIPSWTDRILYKVKDKSWLSVVVNGYNSIDCLKSSDHRPVKAMLEIHSIK